MENGQAAANGAGQGTRQQAVLARLTEIAAELTGIGGERISTDVDLFRIGFDSLLLLQGIQLIEKRLGVRLSLVEMLEEMTTLDAIARHIDAALPPDELGPYRGATTELLAGFEALRLEAMEHVAKDFEGNRLTLSTPQSPDPIDGKISVRRLVWERI